MRKRVVSKSVDKDGKLPPEKGLDISSKGGVNAVSPSPEHNKCIVAGRFVLNVIELTPSTTSVVRTLRGKRHGGYVSSSVDVQWHPMDSQKHLIGSCATNGSVVVWDVEYSASHKLQIYSNHTRTANRIAWHREIPHLLLSGAQDSLMYLFDIRDPSKTPQKFEARSDAVRDVQFNPHYGNYFASAFDNGTVQIWDIRQPREACEMLLTGHNGPVFAIDFHPMDRNMIASGGRDRQVRIWDLHEPKSPVASIQTMASVGRIKWRPGYRHYIATAASLVDHRLHVWDYRQPFFPMLSLISHTDVCTGFYWYKDSSDSLVTVSKDAWLRRLHLEDDAIRPYTSLRTSGITWNVFGELSYFAQPIDRNNKNLVKWRCPPTTSVGFGKEVPEPEYLPFDLPSSASRTLFSRAPAPGNGFGAMPEYECPENIPLNPSRDAMIFRFLAEELVLSGAPLEVMCAQNAEKYRAVGHHELMHIWELVASMLACEEDEPSSEEASMSEEEELSQQQLLHTAPKEEDTHEGHPLLSSDSATSDEDDLILPGFERLDRPRHLFSPDASSVVSVDSPRMLDDLLIRPRSRNHEHTSLATYDFLYVSPIEGKTVHLGDESDLPLELDRFRLSDATPDATSRTDDRSLPPTHMVALPAIGIGTPVDMPVAPVPPAHKTYARLYGGNLWVDFSPILERMMTALIDQGHVQAVAVLACVLSPSRLPGLPPKTITSWFLSYIELLHRMRLWSSAVELANACHDEAVDTWFQRLTTIRTLCPECGKALGGAHGHRCERCGTKSRDAFLCGVCQEVVKGLYAWCQGCAHGGHLRCMHQWFMSSHEKVCPTGCHHTCALLSTKTVSGLPVFPNQ